MFSSLPSSCKCIMQGSAKCFQHRRKPRIRDPNSEWGHSSFGIAGRRIKRGESGSQANIQSRAGALTPKCLEKQLVKSRVKYHSITARAVTRCKAVIVIKTDMGLYRVQTDALIDWLRFNARGCGWSLLLAGVSLIQGLRRCRSSCPLVVGSFFCPGP